MLKSLEILNQINEKMAEIKNLTGAEKVAMFEEIKNLKSDMEIEKQLEADIKVEDKGVIEVDNKVINEIEQDAKVMRGIIRNLAKMPLVEDKELLAPYNVITGEGFIIPKTISTKIKEKIRECKSFRNILPTMTVATSTGSWVVDNTADMELSDMVDGTALIESGNLTFRQVTYALKQKGGLIALTNTILKFSDNDLINFVASVFAKRAITTYNKMAIATLTLGKTKVAGVTGVKSLIKAINTKLDPSMVANSIIVCNQDVYAQFVAEEGTNSNVRFLQPDISQAPVLQVNGCKVEVISNRQMPTVATKATIFVGNMEEAATFIDAGAYNIATSAEAGFLSNVTYCRVIDYVDCVQKDASDEVYFMAEITIA